MWTSCRGYYLASTPGSSQTGLRFRMNPAPRLDKGWKWPHLLWRVNEASKFSRIFCLQLDVAWLSWASEDAVGFSKCLDSGNLPSLEHGDKGAKVLGWRKSSGINSVCKEPERSRSARHPLLCALTPGDNRTGGVETRLVPDPLHLQASSLTSVSLTATHMEFKTRQHLQRL